ncbi:Neutral ceramidase [Termitomyces sp. J132]|nr:Neutral ceramidase [Termitomyces sp. J132]
MLHLESSGEFWDVVPPYFHALEDVFSKASFDSLHAIELLPYSTLSSCKVYPLAFREQGKLDAFLQENLDSSCICPSKSPMASPVFFIKEKDGLLQLVQDYQVLNAIMMKNCCTFTLIFKLINNLQGAQYFTKLDVQEGDKWKATFQTNQELFELLIMFFGLTNSPANFQTMMNNIIAEGIVPTAYLANPATERARYQYNQDKEMTVLRFDDINGNTRGLLSFFPVHGMSLYENNTLVSTDNKGMAAFLYESFVEPSAMPGNTTFVAGFTQSNVGDTSPNTLGAFCESPGKAKQFEAARTVMNGARSPVNGTVRSVHIYVNMSTHSFTLPNGTTVSNCSDGPGAFDFVQGDNSSDTQNPFWELVKGAITPLPSAAQVACQFPKPILLNTVLLKGYAHIPYDWAPSTVDVQMLRVGNFVMLIMPGTLDTYIDKYSSLVPFLADNATGTPPSDLAPVDQTSKVISLQHGVLFDSAPFEKTFGTVLVDVNTTPYHAGDVVSAQFVGANPRNNLRLESTFLTVDRLVDGQWKAVRSDSHPSTTYQWILGTSTVTITWTIESGTPFGTYRLSYFGDSKPVIGSISSFSGISSSFTVS